MPIDSDPDGADRARETAPPNGRDAPERRGDPDARADAEAPTSREQGGRTADDAPEAAGFRQRQLAEHARYQRDVDAAYEADEARRTWAEAVPKLREAWAEHQEKYPERVRASPRTQPDGSWAAEGGRRLTPEQNAEATKACADLRDEADQVILPAMRRVETASPHGRLAGLPHMLKGEDRLKEKIADYLRAPGVTVKGALGKVADSVRFTLQYEAEHYAEGILADVDGLKAEGFVLIKLKNLWHADQYKGINSQWRRPDTGLRFEMQFHTPESLEAKELTHEAYERIRSKTASFAEERELEGYQRRSNVPLATPTGTNRIKDFPE